jgi:signal transduction histidine kinase/DNA-binding NarL/FixJ family response regulator
VKYKKSILAGFFWYILLFPVYSMGQGSISGQLTGFLPRNLHIGTPAFIIANIFLGMIIMVVLYCLTTGIWSRERGYLYLGCFFLGAFFNAVSNLYIRFLLPTPEPYTGSWLMLFSLTLFIDDYLARPLSKTLLLGKRLILTVSGVFFVLSIIQELARGSGEGPLITIMDIASSLIILILLSYLISCAVKGDRRSRFLIVFEALMIIGGISAMGIVKRPVQRMTSVPVELLDGNFLFLIGMMINGFLFSYLLSEKYKQLEIEKVLAERETVQLKEMNSAKTNFMVNISHEIRTPLTVIEGTARQLRNGRWGDSVSANTHHFDTILRNSDRLCKQVVSFLELSRMQTRRRELNFESIDVYASLAALASEFRPLAQQRAIKLSIDVDPDIFLTADPELLETALLNLLSNALKFTDPGGSISAAAWKEEQRLTVRIADTGRGIQKEEQEKIFQRFHRTGDGSEQAQPGTGIGLALVKEIMEQHGGQVEVNSEPGKGSVFTLVFPIKPAVAGPQHPEKRQHNSIRIQKRPYSKSIASMYTSEFIAAEQKPHGNNPPAGTSLHQREAVLLVEDSADMLRYLVDELEPHFTVVTAKNGSAALDKLQDFMPRIIISDIMMPEMDGHTLFDRLQQDTEKQGVPFLFLTGRGERVEKLESLQKGAIDYIEKPFLPDELIAKMHTLIEKNRNFENRYREQFKNSLIRFIDTFENEAAPEQDSSFETMCREKRLTNREIEIALLLRQGLSDKEIAYKLGLSVKTIGNRNTKIFRKLNVSGRVDLLAKNLRAAAYRG